MPSHLPPSARTVRRPPPFREPVTRIEEADTTARLGRACAVVRSRARCVCCVCVCVCECVCVHEILLLHTRTHAHTHTYPHGAHSTHLSVLTSIDSALTSDSFTAAAAADNTATPPGVGMAATAVAKMHVQMQVAATQTGEAMICTFVVGKVWCGSQKAILVVVAVAMPLFINTTYSVIVITYRHRWMHFRHLPTIPPETRLHRCRCRCH